jgi:glycosyltransferase involved in cell wall biosynthesis
MNILWVSPFLPSMAAPHAGGRAVARWIAAAAERHAITLLARVAPHERAAAEALGLRLAAVTVIEFARPAGPLALPRVVGSYARLGRATNRMLAGGRFDLLHVEFVETGLAIEGAHRVPKIVVAHDELTKPARQRLALARGGARLGAWTYLKAVERLQRRICRKFDRVLTLSEADRAALLALDRRLSVGVLPSPISIDLERVRAPAREVAGLVFVGAMYRDVNVDAVRWFCEAVLPRVRAAVPGAVLTIVGAEPPAAVQRLAGVAVRVTGFVDEVEPYYASAAVFVAPLRIAGGVASKTRDAMAAGCAVVTTTIGNVGLDAANGVHLLVGDTPEAFAAAVVRLLRDASLRRQLGEAAQRFALDRFGPAVAAAVLEREQQAVAGAAAITMR